MSRLIFGTQIFAQEISLLESDEWTALFGQFNFILSLPATCPTFGEVYKMLH